MLNFSVSFKPGIPIYEQVIYAVKKAIVAQQLRCGDPFPSVRELSKELRINPNTAQKIISRLVKEKILEMRPGVGSIVAEGNTATMEQRQLILKTETERLIIESKRLSIRKKELLDAIEDQWGKDK